MTKYEILSSLPYEKRKDYLNSLNSEELHEVMAEAQHEAVLSVVTLIAFAEHPEQFFKYQLS